MLLNGNRASWTIEKKYSEKIGNLVINTDHFTKVIQSLIENTSVIFEVTETKYEWIIMFNGGY